MCSLGHKKQAQDCAEESPDRQTDRQAEAERDRERETGLFKKKQKKNASRHI